jgi:thiamine transport system permease protein
MVHLTRRAATPWLLAALPLAFLLAVQVLPALHLLALGWMEALTPSAGWAPAGSPSAGPAAVALAGAWWADIATLASGLAQPLQDAYLRGRLAWSLLQAAVTCVVALALGLPIAWVLARREFAGRAWVLRALLLPFVLPTLVAAIGVLALLGQGGRDTPWLLLYGNVFFNLCVVVRVATDALEQVSASRVAAARSLGASPWRAFWRVEWPAIAPWLMSAMCLVFLVCFSGFGLALVLGGNRYATIEVEIYTLVAHELALAQASVLALWSMGIAAVVAWMYAVLERRLASATRHDRIARSPARGWRQHLAVGAALAVLALVCAAPLLAIGWRAAQAGADAWAVLLEAETLEALWNTLRFTVASVALATLLGLLHALAAQRLVLLRTLVFLPFVVSPVLVGFGLLLVYPQQSGSLWMLVCAYALLAYPWVAKSVAARLDSLPAHYHDAARSLGASPLRVFWRVTLPLISGALRRGMAFAAATAVGEFAVTLFLSRPEWATLTTLIYQRMGRPGAANLDAAMVLSCLLMVLALLVFVLVEWGAQDGNQDKDTHA